MSPKLISRTVHLIVVGLLLGFAGGMLAPRAASADDFERLRGPKVPRWYEAPRTALPSPAPLTDVGRIPGQPGSPPAPRIPQGRTPNSVAPAPGMSAVGSEPNRLVTDNVAGGDCWFDWTWFVGWVRF
jgi:hypothetical protein